MVGYYQTYNNTIQCNTKGHDKNTTATATITIIKNRRNHKTIIIKKKTKNDNNIFFFWFAAFFKLTCIQNILYLDILQRYLTTVCFCCRFLA